MPEDCVYVGTAWVALKHSWAAGQVRQGPGVRPCSVWPELILGSVKHRLHLVPEQNAELSK